MEKRSNPYVPIAILVAGVIVTGGILLSGIRPAGNDAPSETEAELINLDAYTPVSADDHILGSPNARIVIVEYGDLDCPACKSLHPTFKRLVSEYAKTAELAWVYRHFPIEQLHTGTTYKSAASECVASLVGEAAFWEFIDEVFVRNGEGERDLIDIAESVGANRDEFQTCTTAGRFTQTVESGFDEARAMGAAGTPFVIIEYPEGIPSAAITQIQLAGTEMSEPGTIQVIDNNTKIVIQTAFSYDVFKAIVETLLF